jgi:hypothetical protein
MGRPGHRSLARRAVFSAWNALALGLVPVEYTGPVEPRTRAEARTAHDELLVLGQAAALRGDLYGAGACAVALGYLRQWIAEQPRRADRVGRALKVLELGRAA